MLLTKDQILGAHKVPTEDVELPELGGIIRIKAWTGAEHDEFGRVCAAFKFDGAMYAAALACSAVDEDGKRMFDTNGDIQKLAGAVSVVGLERVWKVIERLNKLNKSAVDDIAKN